MNIFGGKASNFANKLSGMLESEIKSNIKNNEGALSGLKAAYVSMCGGAASCENVNVSVTKVYER